MVEKARFVVLQTPANVEVRIRVSSVEVLVAQGTSTIVKTAGSETTVKGAPSVVAQAIAGTEMTPPSLGTILAEDVREASAILKVAIANNRYTFGSVASRCLKVADWLDAVAGDV